MEALKIWSPLPQFPYKAPATVENPILKIEGELHMLPVICGESLGFKNVLDTILLM